jgi:hypothetical protein
VRCTEADQILAYLKTGKQYKIEARLDLAESNELFAKMSEEISELKIAKRNLEEELERVCRLTENYAKEHERRKVKRSQELAKLAANAKSAQDSHIQLCQFIVQLFPQFVHGGELTGPDQARRILLAVAQRLR